MPTRELIFIHGRSQEGKDSFALKKEWIDTLKEGLTKSGLDLPIPEDRIRFPYYGDALDQLVAGVPPANAAQVVVRGPGGAEDPALQAFVASVLEQAARRTATAAGMTDAQMESEIKAVASAQGGGAQVVERGLLNWGWVQGVASFIDRHVPGGSGLSIGLFTRDVYLYITDAGLKKRINTGVRAAMTPGVESVVVGHSLGTVVSYTLLKDEGEAAGWNVHCTSPSVHHSPLRRSSNS